MSDSCNPMGCSLPGSSIHGILQARILEQVAISFSRGSSWPRNRTQVSCITGSYKGSPLLEWAVVPLPRGLPNPGIEPRSPTLQADSLLSEPPGKPKNTGVGSLSFLQRTFPIQELNLGLLHCRQTFHPLSHQGSLNCQGSPSLILERFWCLLAFLFYQREFRDNRRKGSKDFAILLPVRRWRMGLRKGRVEMALNERRQVDFL